MSGYRPAAVVVLADEWTDQGRLIALRLLDAEIAPPLAPAWLVPLSGEWEGVLELHRVVEATQDQATFSTSDDREIPAIPLGLQGWWTPDALGLVTDTDKKWREVPFDDRGSPTSARSAYGPRRWPTRLDRQRAVDL